MGQKTKSGASTVQSGPAQTNEVSHDGEANRGPQALPLGLYLVATPIGNLRDITLRAIDTLGLADRVLCEDTRTTKRLLDAHGIKARKLEAFHEHNEDGRRGRVLAALEAGEAVVLVSDAGTPTISDPGFKLVRAAAGAGFPIFSIPGPSATLSALIISGLPTDRFMFAGFAPPRSGQRRTWFNELQAIPATLIVYETGPRLAASLADAAATLGNRPAMVARELTKFYEELQRGSLDDLSVHYGASPPPRGEIVLVIGGPLKEHAADQESLDAELKLALQAFGVKDASGQVAAKMGLARRDVYARALALRAQV